MRHVFIGMDIIMLLAKISTFLGIIMQIMLVFGGFWKLSVVTALVRNIIKVKKINT